MKSDISKLSGTQISELADAYTSAVAVFEVPPLEAPKKKQKQIRKWICQNYIELIHELPKETNIFSKANSDKDVLSFLKECADIENEIAKEKADRFERDFSGLEPLTRSALKCLTEFMVWPEIKFTGNDVEIVTDDTTAYRRTLTLKNADSVPKNKEGFFCYNLGLAFKKDKNKFCLYGELENPEDESLEIFILNFDDATAKVEAYNSCNNMTVWDNPWELLKEHCYAIYLKSELPGDYCNAQEKELLPLVKEIVAFGYGILFPGLEQFSFVALKQLLCKYGYSKAEVLLEKLEEKKTVGTGFYKASKKLIDLLCRKEYKPLWQEIFDKISNSQAEYPDKVDCIICDKAVLTSVRQEIQTLMQQKGYIGSYPDFVKDGTLDGLHLENSYDITYIVGMEKNVEYHVHCFERIDENNSLTIQFVCGTALLKSGEQETDIYDCLFNAKGRRLFRELCYNLPLENDCAKDLGDIETCVTIAVKKAECIRLNKEEKKEYYGKMIPGWNVFFGMLLVAGGMFGVLMTLGMMLICIIVATVFGQFYAIPELLKEMPWGLSLAISWLGFGIAMGVVTVIALRK